TRTSRAPARRRPASARAPTPRWGATRPKTAPTTRPNSSSRSRARRASRGPAPTPPSKSRTAPTRPPDLHGHGSRSDEGPRPQAREREGRRRGGGGRRRDLVVGGGARPPHRGAPPRRRGVGAVRALPDRAPPGFRRERAPARAADLAGHAAAAREPLRPGGGA